jgi:hypothetical protein
MLSKSLEVQVLGDSNFFSDLTINVMVGSPLNLTFLDTPLRELLIIGRVLQFCFDKNPLIMDCKIYILKSWMAKNDL